MWPPEILSLHIFYYCVLCIAGRLLQPLWARATVFLPRRVAPSKRGMWVVLTTVFLKEVIHVTSSIKYLLSWPLNKSGCGKSTLYCRGLGDSLKLTCFTTRLFSYLFQATNNFQSHLMFMNPHSHTVLHPTKTPTAHAHFCPCVAYDLGACQTAGVQHPSHSPCSVLLGDSHQAGIII